MRTIAWTSVGLALIAASPAAAQSAPLPPTPFHASEDPVLALWAPASSRFENPAPLDPRELAALHGRQGTTITVLSEQDLKAVNRGNTITAETVGSGQIILGENAFQGFAGVGNFVINSGHNNNLQGALTINIVTR